MTPYYETPDGRAKLYLGDVRQLPIDRIMMKSQFFKRGKQLGIGVQIDMGGDFNAWIIKASESPIQGLSNLAFFLSITSASLFNRGLKLQGNLGLFPLDSQIGQNQCKEMSGLLTSSCPIPNAPPFRVLVSLFRYCTTARNEFDPFKGGKASVAYPCIDEGCVPFAILDDRNRPFAIEKACKPSDFCFNHLIPPICIERLYHRTIPYASSSVANSKGTPL